MTLLVSTPDPHTAVSQCIPNFNADQPHPDIIWINADGAAIPIETIRQLQLSLLEPTFELEKKYLLFINLEQSSLETQNALLKTLEEPPAHVQCILFSSNPHMLLGTIRSRCEYIKTENSVAKHKLIDQKLLNLANKTVEEKIALAEQYSDRGEAQRFVIEWIQHLHSELEIKPSLTITQSIKNAQEALKMLQANVNVKLALEWMLFKIV